MVSFNYESDRYYIELDAEVNDDNMLTIETKQNNHVRETWNHTFIKLDREQALALKELLNNTL